MLKMATKPSHKLWQEHVYEGMTLTGAVPETSLNALKDFDLTGDILIATYPKAGTTWTQEMTFLVNTEGGFDSANSLIVGKRCPWIDVKHEGSPSGLDQVKDLPHPRLIKTHMPATLFKKQLAPFNFKLIVVIRNPKDLLVSLYHMYRMWTGLGNYPGTWNEFFEEIVKTKHIYCGDYFQWYMSWVPYKDNPNFIFVKYEDLSTNLTGVIDDMAKFLGKTIDDDLKKKMVAHLSFSQMKESKMTNYDWYQEMGIMDFSISPFMRKGKVGDWKNYFTPEQSEYIDKQYKETLEKAGVHLRFE